MSGSRSFCAGRILYFVVSHRNGPTAEEDPLLLKPRGCRRADRREHGRDEGLQIPSSAFPAIVKFQGYEIV